MEKGKDVGKLILCPLVLIADYYKVKEKNLQ